MKKLLIWLPVGLVVAGYLFWRYAQTEAYCFFYPSIDTRFAPGYSEQAFSQIKTGMTIQAVQQQLGQPLHVQQHAKGELWSYTQDGKCTWGDWAWLCRQVDFHEGRVVEVIHRVVHN